MQQKFVLSQNKNPVGLKNFKIHNQLEFKSEHMQKAKSGHKK